ncbi:hypothetical protein NMG60_11019480 [Bertholletia excelsa]
MAEDFRVTKDEESLVAEGIPAPSPAALLVRRNIEEKRNKDGITLRERLGLEEFFYLNVWRASLGEVFGTAGLVFMIDTIVISTVQSKTDTPNLILSILVAAIIAILLLATAPVSGGHINPIVTFSAALLGVIYASRAIIYILAQCLGAILGALMLKAVVSSTIEQTFSLGACTLTVITPGPDGPVTSGIETRQALWMEIVCCFLFLYTSIWMLFDARQLKERGPGLVCLFAGFVLGLLVYISTMVTGRQGYSGAGLNPARCFGPAIVRGGHIWTGHWVFWVGPAIACMIFYLCTKIIPGQHFHAEGYKHDFFNTLKALFG